MKINNQILDQIDIVHRYFGKKSAAQISELFGEDYFNQFDDHAIYHYFIYINEPIPIVLFHLSGGDHLEERTNRLPDLKLVLKQIPELNFDTLLFVLTLYGVIGEVNPIQSIQNAKNFEPLPNYDDLLSPTFGYLFYKHQLEQLITRISNDEEINALQLRKDWNCKKPSVIDVFDKMEIQEGQSLTDFIKSRTIEENHFVWNPNFSGAQKLWNHLIKNTL